MNREDRNRIPGRVEVYPASAFDVTTPGGSRNFAELLKFQYGLSDEEAERRAKMQQEEAMWEDRVGLLVEVTAPEHRFYRRLG